MIFLFFFIYALEVNANNHDSLIVWNVNYKLVWADFRAKPDTGYIIRYREKPKAVTNTILARKYKKLGNTITYEVNCLFNRNKSWTVSNDTILLEHERLHFDITELYRRKIIAAFDSLKADGCTDIKIYEEVFFSYAKKHRIKQDLYDQETIFGSLMNIQKLWKIEIYQELANYNTKPSSMEIEPLTRPRLNNEDGYKE
jgi:hypothetical protein